MAALSEMTQEMAVAVAAAKLEDGRRCENEADEQALLEQLLQGNGMEENCGKQKTEREPYERNETREESIQSNVKVAVEDGREGMVMTPKGSVQETERPYFVVSKWEEESDGASNQDLAAVRRGKLRGYEESNNVPMTKKDMNVFFRKVKQLSEMVETAGRWCSEEWYERTRERNEGVTPRGSGRR